MVKSRLGVTKKWFKTWSNKYDRTLGSIGFHKALLDLVLKNSGVKDGDKVLDIGCGTGLLSLKLLQAADCSLVAIDNSREMMAIFRDKIDKLRLKGRVTCKIMDAAAFKFKDKSFDVVVSSVVLHHLKDKTGPFKKIYKMLKPGGVFVIGEIDMDTTGRHTDAQRLRRIVSVLEEEWTFALKDVGVEAFAQMYDNGKKHILNQGEYCLSLKQWAGLCRKAGFTKVRIENVPAYRGFGAVISRKPKK